MHLRTVASRARFTVRLDLELEEASTHESGLTHHAGNVLPPTDCDKKNYKNGKTGGPSRVTQGKLGIASMACSAKH